MRDARKRDARGVTAMLDAVAAEPQVTLVLQPGEASAADWRRRIVDSVARRRAVCSWSPTPPVPSRVTLDCGPTRTRRPRTSPGSACRWPPAFRGVGAGGALLETALEWAASAGFRRAVLGVFPENARPWRSTSVMGSCAKGSAREQYRRGGRYHDEVLMARPLTGR